MSDNLSNFAGGYSWLCVLVTAHAYLHNSSLASYCWLLFLLLFVCVLARSNTDLNCVQTHIQAWHMLVAPKSYASAVACMYHTVGCSPLTFKPSRVNAWQLAHCYQGLATVCHFAFLNAYVPLLDVHGLSCLNGYYQEF